MLIPENSVIYYFDANSSSHLKKKKNSKCKRHQLLSRNKIEHDVFLYEVDGLYVLGNKPMKYYVRDFSSYNFKPYVVGLKNYANKNNIKKIDKVTKQIKQEITSVEKLEPGFVFFIYDNFKHEYCKGTLQKCYCKIYDSNIEDFIEITCFVCTKCKKYFIKDYSKEKYGGCNNYYFLNMLRQKNFISKYLIDVTCNNLSYKLLKRPPIIYYDNGNRVCRYCNNELNTLSVMLGTLSYDNYVSTDILFCDNCCKIYLSNRTSKIDDVVVNNYNIKFSDFEDYFKNRVKLRRIEEEEKRRQYEYENKKRIEYLESLIKVNLTYNDILIVGNTTKHSEEHSLSDVMAVINVVTKSKNIISLEVPAFYCKLCDKYYMLADSYSDVIEFGLPLVKTVEYDRFISGDYSFELLNERSKLNLLGYNANSYEELSDLQRQNVLSDIVDSGLMTRNEIASFIQFLINTHSGDKNQRACDKWSKDKKFIMSYSNENLKRINVKTIKLYKNVRSKYE